MGIVTLVVLGLTLVGMAFGALFGLIRGRDRALLRLGLIILSVILALALRGTVVDFVMNFEIDGATLQETMLESFTSEDASIPAGLQNLIFALLEILIGFVAYFILLFALRFLTWFFLFPFLKLIIRKIEKKRALKLWAANAAENVSNESNPEAAPEAEKPTVKKLTRKERKKLVKKHRGMGALVGLVQGIFLAYFLFAPLTCLATQFNQIANVKIDGELLLEIPEDVGLAEYTESIPGKIYKTTGGWLYNMMTTTTDADGNEVSLESTLDSVVVILDVADAATSLEDEIKILEDENAEPEEVISALNSLGDKLVSIGNSMEDLDENTMDMITDLVTEVAGEELSDEEMDELIEMLTPEFFVKAGGGIKAFAEYEQVKLDGTELTQEQANNIASNAYNCITFIEGMELDVNDEDKAKFESAIEAIDGISAEDKDALFNVFGIQ